MFTLNCIKMCIKKLYPNIIANANTYGLNANISTNNVTSFCCKYTLLIKVTTHMIRTTIHTPKSHK